MIRGQRLDLDHEKLGFGVTVFLGVKLATKGRVSLEDFERAVTAIPEVQTVEHILGLYDYRLRVVARDIADFERVLRRRIMTLPGLGNVEANVLLSEERRPGPHRLTGGSGHRAAPAASCANQQETPMPALLDTVDPDGLLEYSVVFTDRSLNHMSASFQEVMRVISSMLKEVYSADAVAVVPGGGSYAMESVARQFGRGAHALIVRNGWFSYRWSQIFDAGQFTAETTVCLARQSGNGAISPFAPAPIDEVVAKIREAKPDVVFAPHVETSAGLILPDDYHVALADAAHEVVR